MGIGMAIGAILVPRLEKRYSPGMLFPRTIAAFAVGMFLFALNRNYFLACLMAVGGGFCISMLSVTGNNYIVQNVSNALRGRVFTALESVIRIALLISMVVTAPVSDFVGAIVLRILAGFGITSVLGSPLTGARITLLLSGCIVAAAAIYCFRKMREDSVIGQDGNADTAAAR
jgi:dTMP kinase